MAHLLEMLAVAGGFPQAEALAREKIAAGEYVEWLDLALLQHAQGNIDDCRKSLDEYKLHAKKDNPNNAVHEFACSWFDLYDGNLQKGLKHIEAGRKIGCLGDNVFAGKFTHPQWDGKLSIDGKTILLYCEGGLGDQILGLRAAKWLSDMNARVIVVCSLSLMRIMATAPGVSAVLACAEGTRNRADVEVTHLCHYDYWIPSQSAARLCNREWSTLWQTRYLETVRDDNISNMWKQIIPDSYKFNIGLRWSGNPEFEHQQFRKFPIELMFNAINGIDANFFSLQRDDPDTICPSNIRNLELLLSKWEMTVEAISRLDLVITSCTSIAHVAGAMGKPTWVIVPVMPYFPWARPGPKSDWYPSVRIYRQKTFENWEEPFEEITRDLRELVME